MILEWEEEELQYDKQSQQHSHFVHLVVRRSGPDLTPSEVHTKRVDRTGRLCRRDNWKGSTSMMVRRMDMMDDEVGWNTKVVVVEQ